MKSRMPITGGQLFWITCMFDLGMAAFVMISPTIQRVQNDAWISLAISGLLSMTAAWIEIRLSLYYPDKTFVEYVNDIVGSWIGKALLASCMS
ncbi:GerAB/ArcD/ProY family transporter [Alicyclobacillus sp. SO9]|uniref:GerAB/ArcD/ProY family transporter n=1 Tax=Alicyclobacillus sp. SO9 TaxID=2665646 RepID=UPI0018E83CC1|nr:GerAB/ArcD/ProY family transporter [Alicyclobacillus sp. SO9]QQE79695.1 GerAB/ArcD/ProY family transporter [Alicyclobacillus sp. SO9]